jgi:hypothetical protein
MSVTGGPPVRGGGGMPQRIIQFALGARIANDRRWIASVARMSAAISGLWFTGLTPRKGK